MKVFVINTNAYPDNKGVIIMAKYLAIHPVDPPVNADDVGPIAKKAKAAVTKDAYWVKSWLKLTDDGKVAAVSVKSALKQSIPELPFSEVSQMGEIHGEDFR
jgi:hypothetical protein